MNRIGIGDTHCKLAVYIGNRPPLDEYLLRENIMPASDGELAMIGNETGNHWREIINIYAKLAYMLDAKKFSTWQVYRDSFLLRQGSQQALLFNRRIVTETPGIINIICGKTHALDLEKVNDTAGNKVDWIDNNFAIDPSRRLIVTPYFDYRQLSNLKLEKLVDIIRSLDL